MARNCWGLWGNDQAVVAPMRRGDPATLLRPAGDDVLEIWLVSKQVNSPRNNGAELLGLFGVTLSGGPRQCGDVHRQIITADTGRKLNRARLDRYNVLIVGCRDGSRTQQGVN